MRFLLSKLKEKYLSCQFLRLFIFSILVILLVALFKYVVFANDINVSDIPSCSATIDDESNISSSNPTGERSATLDVSSFGNNKVFNSNSDIKTTNFLFRLNFVDSGKNHSEFRIITLISAQNNDVVLENGKNQSGENFICYQNLINPSGINYNGNTKVKKTSNIAYYVTFDNLSTYNTDMMNYLRNYASTGEFSQATIDIKNGNWEDGEPSKNILYDLEVPLNFKIKQKSLVDLGILEMGKDSTFYLYWEQSDNLNTNGWKTEIYFKEKGKAKKHWYSLQWTKYECKWHFFSDTDNYKNKFTFNVEKITQTDEEIKEQVGFKPYETSVTKLDFMIRNKYYDESTGIMHYSNYVYLDNSNGSGSSGSSMDFKGYEIDGKEFDKGNFDDDHITNNRVTDSDSYNGSNVSGNTSSNDVTSAISILKSISNDIKEFPAFFSNFFSFIPDHFVYALSALIVATIGIAFLKAVL